MILIQHIRSIWTKASRGGSAAASRNSVPEAVRFSPGDLKPAPRKILRQSVVYGEANGFAEPLRREVVEVEPGVVGVGCVKVRVSGEGLAVAYEYDYECGGAPPRSGRPGEPLKEEVVLRPGEWARVRYNGRFRGDEWWYEKVVVNVGSFTEFDAGVFLSTRPAREISQMAALR